MANEQANTFLPVVAITGSHTNHVAFRNTDIEETFGIFFLEVFGHGAAGQVGIQNEYIRITAELGQRVSESKPR